MDILFEDETKFHLSVRSTLNSTVEFVKKVLEENQGDEKQWAMRGNVKGLFSKDTIESWGKSVGFVSNIREEFLKVLEDCLLGRNGFMFEKKEEYWLLRVIREEFDNIVSLNPELTDVAILSLRNVEGFHETRVLNSKSSDREKEVTGVASSYYIFLKFASPKQLGSPSRVLSKESFRCWLETRRSAPKEPERSFKKALIAHLRARDGRKPFTKIVEKIILEEVRKKQLWPCFEGCSRVVKVGLQRFRHKGYNEMLEEPEEAPSADKRRSKRTASKKSPSPSKRPRTVSKWKISLDEFAGVSLVEIDEVSQMKHSLLEAQNKYKQALRDNFNAKERLQDHLFSDLVLLRFLRHNEGNQHRAAEAYEKFLEWRITYQVYATRNKLIEKNPTWSELWSLFTAFHPAGQQFLCQNRPNSLLEFWTLMCNRSDPEYRKAFVKDQIMQCEYRSLLLDSISVAEKRVMTSAIVYDLSELSSFLDWDSFNAFDSFGFSKVEPDNRISGKIAPYDAIPTGLNYIKHAKSWVKEYSFSAGVLSTSYGGYFNSFTILGEGDFYSMFGAGFFINSFYGFSSDSVNVLSLANKDHLEKLKFVSGFSYKGLLALKKVVVEDGDCFLKNYRICPTEKKAAT
eukprot:maker-scaffold_2-snap-gene-15.42-mRNA-1 protein AED:0.00 eAED:0.00 QI:89/1/1/1/1/1/5/128/626